MSGPHHHDHHHAADDAAADLLHRLNVRGVRVMLAADDPRQLDVTAADDGRLTADHLAELRRRKPAVLRLLRAVDLLDAAPPRPCRCPAEPPRRASGPQTAPAAWPARPPPCSTCPTPPRGLWTCWTPGGAVPARDRS